MSAILRRPRFGSRHALVTSLSILKILAVSKLQEGAILNASNLTL